MTTRQRRTARLILRRFRDADRPAFAALNADPSVMAYFPRTLTPAESDALIERMDSQFDRLGFGPWALELVSSGDVIGFTGLFVPGFEAHFTPAVEVGWRLAAPAWGHGYASEAGRASLALAFDEIGLDEVVSFTSALNTRSESVMRRLGMTREPTDDFLHPRLAPEHRLAPHVLYRMAREAWSSRARDGAGRLDL
jgi:RimJ/RimL family protein N-acetyltransferase